jgi:hypothetical protein
MELRSVFFIVKAFSNIPGCQNTAAIDSHAIMD